MAVDDGAGGGAAAEMEGDDAGLGGGFFEVGGDGAGDKGIAEAVEAVLAQHVLLGNGLVDGIGADVLGHGGMELGVEAGQVDGARQLLEAETDDLEGLCVVQGGQIVELLERRISAVGDDLGWA